MQLRLSLVGAVIGLVIGFLIIVPRDGGSARRVLEATPPTSVPAVRTSSPPASSSPVAPGATSVTEPEDNFSACKCLSFARSLRAASVTHLSLRCSPKSPAIAGNSVVRGWRITGSTPLGEVQLAEPLGNRIVLVAKTYSDDRSKDIVLVLDRTGIVQTFSVDPHEWAESAPLARFRLDGSSLYQLGSAPSGAFVDRFDLEVQR